MIKTGLQTILPKFKILPTALTMASRCVDGRPDFSKTDKGPQMLGGSLHPIVLKALEQRESISQKFVSSSLTVLKNEPYRYGIGDHRDNHHHEANSCGCGFADRLPEIIKKAQEQEIEITNRLKNLGIENIKQTYETINDYLLDKIKDTGETLVSQIENNGGTIENLSGDHNEQAAFVNLKTNTTLDTNRLNKNGEQAFNLDLWAVIPQANTLGVSEKFAYNASLILYVATEMVLVEDKGKSQLPVFIHK